MPQSSRFLRFLAAGGIAAVVNFGSRIVLSRWLSFPIAIVVAYLFGLITAFMLNRRFVFASSTNRLHTQILWFVAINGLAIVQTLVVSVLLADVLLPRMGVTWNTEAIAHACGVITPVLTSYVGHKRFSFSIKS